MSTKTTFWADQIAEEAIQKHTKNLVCTGITPSGHIHIGNMREVLTGDAVFRSLEDQNANASLVYIGDTYDSLRKVYPFLDPDEYTRHVGKPISEIPCPCGEHESYAEHFLEPFLQAVAELGLHPQVIRADRLYKEGKYADAILKALENKDKIAEILKDLTGKETSADWSPVNPLCEACGRITTTTVLDFSAEKKTVNYSCSCGHQGNADITTGGAKLTWRVDWPARWSILGVTVEPFGKDHASRGGSYDTGRRIAREIFDYEAPVPVVYEWISLKGKGDMSSSKGNVVSINDMLEVVPPDVLRYLVFRTKPKKAISFNPGLPLLSIVDELDNAENKNRDPRAYKLSIVSEFGQVGVPFKHLVNIIQIAGEDDEEAIAIIERGGYTEYDRKALLQRLHYARRWLHGLAPESMKFSPQQELPDVATSLAPEIKRALKLLGEKMDDSMNGEALHSLFYEIRDEAGIETSDLFRGIYLSLIGKERGPRAGWFIATLGVPFARKRFQEVAQS